MPRCVRSRARDPAGELLDGLFGPERRLYKRFAQYSAFQMPDQYHRLARRPYPWLVVCAENLAELLQRELGMEVRPHDVLFDAPPVKLEVQFNVEIHFPKEGCFRPLGDVSPVVRTLAREQFDDYVKRVRVFVHPRLLSDVDRLRTATPWFAKPSTCPTDMIFPPSHHFTTGRKRP